MRIVVGQLRTLTLRPTCPQCGAGAVLRILYGMPAYEGVRTAEAEGVEYAGCTVGLNDPQFRCRICGTSWRDAESQDW